MRGSQWLKVGAVAVLGALSGCASYQYDLTQPRELARHVGDHPTDVRTGPLVYTLQTSDSRLVMEVRNPTAEPIYLLGDRSSIVDPSGQSHPVRSEAIAPGSFVKLVLPPLRPQIQNTGPAVFIGGGFATAGRFHHGRQVFVGNDFYYAGEPEYMTVYDPSDATFFEWDGETDLRMNLSFSGSGGPFAQGFVFHREKVR